jgi:hypothetical protein
MKLFAEISPRRPEFDPRSESVGFVVSKVALEKVFSKYFGFLYQLSFHYMTSIIYCHVTGVPWLILTGSRLDDWIYWHLLLQSLLFTINYSATANLPTSQITITHYQFPGNGFLRGTITSSHSEVFLPFLVQSHWNADPPELDPILQFNLAINRPSIYSLSMDHIENTFFY